MSFKRCSRFIGSQGRSARHPGIALIGHNGLELLKTALDEIDFLGAFVDTRAGRKDPAKKTAGLGDMQSLPLFSSFTTSYRRCTLIR